MPAKPSQSIFKNELYYLSASVVTVSVSVIRHLFFCEPPYDFISCAQFFMCAYNMLARFRTVTNFQHRSSENLFIVWFHHLIILIYYEKLNTVKKGRFSNFNEIKENPFVNLTSFFNEFKQNCSIEPPIFNEIFPIINLRF